MIFKGLSRSNLFLIELIIAVIFFVSVGAITVQVFAKARQLADDSMALNGAVIAVQTAAETDKTVPFEDILPITKTTGYSKDWEFVDLSEAKYTVTTEISFEKRKAGTMVFYHYTAKDKDKIIYQLTTQKYYPEITVPTPSNEVVD